MTNSYFKSIKINFFHGIMFHHFHDKNNHKKSQGSISATNFEKILKFIGIKNILNPNDFISLLKKNKLKKNQVCLSFDDNLKSQYDIALPILAKYNIKAFFFIYSSSLSKNPDLLEIYRYFRTNFYKTINHFYKDFNNTLFQKYGKKKVDLFFDKNKKKIIHWKMNFKVYSTEDIKFRFLRDSFLSKKEYLDIMSLLFKKKKFKYKNILNSLFMNSKNIKKLDKLGHEIGLHSSSHPTNFKILNKTQQYSEYKKNKEKLNFIIKEKKINSMSHPCGSYNSDTLKILKKMNIEIGFRSDLAKINKINNSNLEIARIDHSIINYFLKN